MIFSFFKSKMTPSHFYMQAKELTRCLYKFPYLAPSDVPASVRNDEELMEIVTTAHLTTIYPEGQSQQTTIDAAERIRLQGGFKARIYELLDKCLAEDPEHGPALLLYPQVAGFNTRAKDRAALIELYERFLPKVDVISKESRAYLLIQQDIEGLHGNLFETVERHLADYHYGLAKLYRDTKQLDLARHEYAKSCDLAPKVYGRGKNKIKLL